jgi:hypothetical protein
MLNSISWQQYLTAITLLTIAWYAFVLLRYYRPELTARFQTKNKSLPLIASAPILGSIKTDQTTVNSEELIFSSGEPDDISDHSLPPGPSDELLAETRTLVQAFRDTPNKTEFLSLLELLLSKYEPYEDEIDLKVIRSLATQLPFNIEEHEWPQF